MITEALKATLEQCPGLQFIYMNEAGDWAFYPHEGFDIVITREEALAPDPVKVAEPEPVPEPVTDPSTGSK